MIATLKAVPKKEGFLGLYKGNGAMMVRIFPYGAIQFMAFDNYKKVNVLLSFVRFPCIITERKLHSVSVTHRAHLNQCQH